MLRSLAFAAIIAVVVACPAVCFAGAKPMPPAAALESAKRLIIDTFSKELSAADKVPAIKAMLEAAQSTTGDDPAQAALYLSAAEVAARSGETKLAFEAIDSLGRAFECDALALKDSLLEAAAAEFRKERGARTSEVRTSIANRGLELADSAAAAGRFDVAESALKTAGAAASKLRDAELRKELAAKRKELDKAKRLREHEQAAYDDAVKTLETKPDDPAANEAVGKHLAFDRRDWAQGLKYLAKSGDGDLQNAARADLTGADSSGRTSALGDLWWSLGEDAESPRDRSGYKSRAVFWYTRAASGLSGFAKTRLEKRIKEAGDEALAAAAEQTGGDSANGKFIDITLAPGVLMRLFKIPASKDGKIKEFYWV